MKVSGPDDDMNEFVAYLQKEATVKKDYQGKEYTQIAIPFSKIHPSRTDDPIIGCALDSDDLVFNYTSAYDEPTEALEALSAKFPNLKIQNEQDESGNGVYGISKYEGGCQTGSLILDDADSIAYNSYQEPKDTLAEVEKINTLKEIEAYRKEFIRYGEEIEELDYDRSILSLKFIDIKHHWLVLKEAKFEDLPLLLGSENEMVVETAKDCLELGSLDIVKNNIPDKIDILEQADIEVIGFEED